MNKFLPIILLTVLISGIGFIEITAQNQTFKSDRILLEDSSNTNHLTYISSDIGKDYADVYYIKDTLLRTEKTGLNNVFFVRMRIDKSMNVHQKLIKYCGTKDELLDRYN